MRRIAWSQPLVNPQQRFFVAGCCIFQNAVEYERVIGDSSLKGFRITRVYEGTTAEKAGLEVGDFIVAVDGEKLTASSPEDFEELPTLIRQYRAGTTAELTVLRGKEEMKIPVELIRAPKAGREMKK